MRTIAFDIGCSSIKTDNHKNIPSIVGPARDLSDVPMLGHVSPEENLQIEVHGEQYFVGTLAARHSSNPVFSLKKERYDSKQGMVLMETTIALLADNNEAIRVITGLPVDYQKTQRSNLEQKLKETHAVVFNGQLQRTFVREVLIMSRKTRQKTNRINVRIRSEDVEIQAYIESLHPSVSLSDMARQSILYCISNQVFNHPVNSSHHPHKMVQKYASEPSRKIEQKEQPIDKSSKESEDDDSDFSSLLNSWIRWIYKRTICLFQIHEQ